MSRFVVCLAALSLACAEVPSADPIDTGSAVSGGEDMGSNGTTPPTETSSGSDVLDSQWSVMDRFLTLNECGMEAWLEDQALGEVEITGHLNQGFELLHNRGLEDCTMREDEVDAYRCDRRQDEDTSVQEDFGIDALLLLDIWATGTLVLGDTLEMTTEIITDCQGSGCWLAALETGGFPCHSTVVVTAEPLP